METQTSTAGLRTRPEIYEGDGRLGEKHETYITPYLPKIANYDIKMHIQNQRQPVMLRVLAQTSGAKCLNCAGAGFIYVVFCEEGPYSNASSSQPSTWWDGNGQFGKGWYIIERTMPYKCPECSPKKGA